MKKIIKIIALVVAAVMVLATLSVIIFADNSTLGTTEYTVTGDRLPQAFSGFKIAQISDLHNAEMGENNERLIAALKQAEPDIIVITGDFIDSRRTDTEVALKLAAEAVGIAPTYYITGNHESRIESYPDFAEQLAATGVVLLQNELIELEHDGDSITLVGINDPSFVLDEKARDERPAAVKAALSPLMQQADGYTVLLAHRPELMDTYAECGADLVFSGHSHGGQIRLPHLGGLIAPDEGLFPQYDGGLYTSGGTTMVVSRGIGNSLFPFRVNNCPELVVVELQK